MSDNASHPEPFDARALAAEDCQYCRGAGTVFEPAAGIPCLCQCQSRVEKFQRAYDAGQQEGRREGLRDIIWDIEAMAYLPSWTPPDTAAEIKRMVQRRIDYISADPIKETGD